MWPPDTPVSPVSTPWSPAGSQRAPGAAESGVQPPAAAAPADHARCGAKSPALSPTGASLGNQISRRRQSETLWCFGYYRRPAPASGPCPWSLSSSRSRGTSHAALQSPTRLVGWKWSRDWAPIAMARQPRWPIAVWVAHDEATARRHLAGTASVLDWASIHEHPSSHVRDRLTRRRDAGYGEHASGEYAAPPAEGRIFHRMHGVREAATTRPSARRAPTTPPIPATRRYCSASATTLGITTKPAAPRSTNNSSTAPRRETDRGEPRLSA